MPKYLVKVGISNSIENSLINDLNQISELIYTAGGKVVNLKVKSRARQIWLQVDADHSLVEELLRVNSNASEYIKSIFLIDDEQKNGMRDELCFAGFFHGRSQYENFGTRVYPH